MKYIFAGIGGCGSSHAIRSLELKFKVHSKPDTYFVQEGEPYTRKKGNPHQLLTSSGLAAQPTAAATAAFKKRTKYSFDCSMSIEKNLEMYIKFIHSSPKLTVFFNSIPKMSFFSKHNISNVVFLVRHPLDAYISFTKPNRHLNLVEGAGINSTESIDYYINSWSSVVRESLAAPESVLLRHEFFNADVKKCPNLAFLKTNWKRSTNVDVLSTSASQYLKDSVSELYSQIYPQWKLNNGSY